MHRLLERISSARKMRRMRTNEPQLEAATMRLTRATTTLGRKRTSEQVPYASRAEVDESAVLPPKLGGRGGGISRIVPEETVIGIQEEYITLAQLLKMAGIIGSGGEAKYYLMDTPVIVNGEPEQRRGKKLRPGDVIITPGAAPIRLAAMLTSTGSTPVPESE